MKRILLTAALVLASPTVFAQGIGPQSGIGLSSDFSPSVSWNWTASQNFLRGTNSAPAITFGGDTNSGIYSNSANQVNVALSGSRSAQFQSGGLSIFGSGFRTFAGSNTATASNGTNLVRFEGDGVDGGSNAITFGDVRLIANTVGATSASDIGEFDIALAFQAASPNKTATFIANTNGIAAALYSQAANHFIGQGTAPTILQGTGSGNNGTTTGLDANAHDGSFLVAFTTGLTPTGTGATIWTVTFNTAYATAPHCVFSPQTVAAANLNSTSSPFLTTGTGSVSMIAGTTAITGSVAMGWFVKCEQ